MVSLVSCRRLVAIDLSVAHAANSLAASEVVLVLRSAQKLSALVRRSRAAALPLVQNVIETAPNSLINLVSDILYLVLPVEASSHSLVSFDEPVQLAGQFLVLLVQHRNVLVQGINLELQVGIAVEQSGGGDTHTIKVLVEVFNLELTVSKTTFELLVSLGHLLSAASFEVVGSEQLFLVVVVTLVGLSEEIDVSLVFGRCLLETGDVAVEVVEFVSCLCQFNTLLISDLSELKSPVVVSLDLVFEVGSTSLMVLAFTCLLTVEVLKPLDFLCVSLSVFSQLTDLLLVCVIRSFHSSVFIFKLREINL